MWEARAVVDDTCGLEEDWPRVRLFVSTAREPA
jgi:hypothetical protein